MTDELPGTAVCVHFASGKVFKLTGVAPAVASIYYSLKCTT